MDEYGRKPYRSNKYYPEFMQSRSAKSIWDRVTETIPELAEFAENKLSLSQLSALSRRIIDYVTQSELKKPYDSDDYIDMESDWEGLPSLKAVDGIDQPWNMQQPYPSSSSGLCGDAVFNLEVDDGWCAGETKIMYFHGTLPITDIEISWSFYDSDMVVRSGIGTNLVTAYVTVDADEPPSGFITFRAYMANECGVTGYSTENVYRSETGCRNFIFDLDRGDGTHVDGTILQDVRIKRSTGTFCTVTKSYDAVTGYWTFQITDDLDPDGLYWVEYQVETPDETIWQQYPETVRSSQKYDNGDLIEPGKYEDTTAYFEVTVAWELTPIAYADLESYNTPAADLPPAPACTDGGAKDADIFKFTTQIAARSGNSIEWSTTIKSNINYEITMASKGGTDRDFGARGQSLCTAFYCDELGGYYDGADASGDGACFSVGVLGTSAINCTYSEELFDDIATITETVSDGLDASSYAPSATVGKYSDSAVIAGLVAGKTHSFEYSGSSNDITFSCDEDFDPAVEDCQDCTIYYHLFYIVASGGSDSRIDFTAEIDY